MCLGGGGVEVGVVGFGVSADKYSHIFKPSQARGSICT